MRTNAQQVAAFEKLLGTCYTLGTGYNPSKPSIVSTSLNSLLQNAKQALETVKEDEALLALLINNRKETFRTLRTFSTRIYRAAMSSDASAEDILEIKRLKDRIAPPGKAKPKAAVDGQESRTRSSGLYNFGKIAENFGHMVEILEGIPSYTPNEPDLSIQGLKARSAKLHEQNLSVSNAESNLKNSRIRRNELLYGQKGIYKTAIAVKNYVYSVYGMTSEQARQFGRIEFKPKI
jgi:hypothetical protein